MQAATPLRVKNKDENAKIKHFLAVKSVLLHSIGNAGHASSREHIIEHAKANHGHPEIRHTAMKALRHYSCEEVRMCDCVLLHV